MGNLLNEMPEYVITENSFGVTKKYLYEGGMLFRDFKSHKKIGSLPLVHITLGKNPETGKRLWARGFLAIGKKACGVIAIGHMAFGVIAIGQLAIGLILAVGQLGIAPFFAIGQLAVSGYFALGQLAIAQIAIGQFVFGIRTWGQVVNPDVINFLRQKFG